MRNFLPVYVRCVFVHMFLVYTISGLFLQLILGLLYSFYRLKKMFVNYIVHDVLECEQEVPGRRGTDTETNRGSSAPSSSLANNTYIVIKIVHELL